MFIRLRLCTSSLFLLSLLFSCSKRDTTGLKLILDPFADSVYHYLKDHLPHQELTTLQWQEAVTLTADNQPLFFLIKSGSSSGIMILVERKPSGFDSHRIQMHETVTGETGWIRSESIESGRWTTYYYSAKRVTSIVRSEGGSSKVTTVARGHTLQLDLASPQIALNEQPKYQELPEVVYTYQVATTPKHFYNLFYMTGGGTSYSHAYTSASMLSGGGSANGRMRGQKVAVAQIPIHDRALEPIPIRKELGCLTLTDGAIYTLRINVNQPRPNTRTVIDINAEREVGHTYLTLTQRNPNGTIISRNVGWYPGETAKPNGERVPGAYEDDTGLPYAVSLSISVTGLEMQKVKRYLQGLTTYEVERFNCTHAAVNAFAQVGARLPQTIGTVSVPTFVPGQSVEAFRGVNPGDLGQDIRALDATTFGKQNGGRKVVIEKYNGNFGESAKSGTCK